jgi:hypothetical protein
VSSLLSAERRWRQAHVFAEAGQEVAGIAEAAALCNVKHFRIRAGQQLLRLLQT